MFYDLKKLLKMCRMYQSILNVIGQEKSGIILSYILRLF